jgi:hypothetical protein
VNQFTKSGEKLQTVTIVLDSELLPGAGQRANTNQRRRHPGDADADYRPLMVAQVVIELSGGVAEAIHRGERASFGIAENEILACMRLNGSDGSIDSEWQTSANYILVEIGQND